MEGLEEVIHDFDEVWIFSRESVLFSDLIEVIRVRFVCCQELEPGCERYMIIRRSRHIDIGAIFLPYG